MSDTKFWAQKYIDEGWSPIPIPKGEKGPRIGGWEQQDFAAADFGDDDNIGVHLGKPLGGKDDGPRLYDVDIDDPMAVKAADLLLAQTNRIHGRPSKPRSHRFYICNEQIDHYVVHGLGGSSDTIIELRGISPTSRAYTQTVVPCSIHPSGEQLAWVDEGKPGHFALAAPFILQVRDIGIATLFARAFPGSGHRHEPRMALAGFLYRAVPDEGWVKAIGRAVMLMCGGSEQDWLDVARTTIAKLKSDPDATVTGGAKLKELLTDGEQVIKKVNTLLGRVDQAAVDEVIERFNRQYFIVTAGTTPCVADDSDPTGVRLYTYDAFKKIHIKDRMPSRRVQVKHAGKVTEKTREGKFAADVWLEHKDGKQYRHLVYSPPPIAHDERDYNGWKGFAVEPVEGPFPLIEAHVRDVICGGDDDIYAWVMNWCAALVQRPGEHANTALTLQGGQRTGKGFFAEDLLGGMFDQRHFITMSQSDQFYGPFAGELLSGRCLVFLDEATWGGDVRDSGTLKQRITGHRLIVNRKNIAQVHERSMLHLVIASNNERPVGVDRDDERFVCLRVVNERANAPAYFKPLYAELENGGRAAFLHALMTLPIDDDLLRQPPSTDAKGTLKAQSQPAEADWWEGRLRAAAVLSMDKTWPTIHVKAAVHNAYLLDVTAIGVHRRLSDDRFATKLKEMCPGIQTDGTRRPRAWVFPSLTDCRLQFATWAKRDIDWSE